MLTSVLTGFRLIVVDDQPSLRESIFRYTVKASLGDRSSLAFPTNMKPSSLSTSNALPTLESLAGALASRFVLGSLHDKSSALAETSIADSKLDEETNVI